jgi:stearoyl-CoA desaturase (delta-9 desaturase)
MRNDVPTVIATPGSNPVQGRVRWAPSKSLWWFAMVLGGVLAVVEYTSWSGIAVFLISSAVTLCLGHSLGMHRRLIHQSYECPLWMERLFVYFGTLVGMAGPLGMVRTHDMRDWAQRQADCHDYFAHRRSFWRDAWWQLHCELQLDHPPRFEPPATLRQDPVLMFVERSWMLQQLPWALVLGLLGGAGWVLWGVCLRVSVRLTGHWLVGHFAHRQGHRSWHVQGAGVQGHNVRGFGLITFGESWHNNHHAFPGSARLGLYPGQPDPGWWVLCVLRQIGWVWNVTVPAALPPRSELQALDCEAETVRRALPVRPDNRRPV